MTEKGEKAKALAAEGANIASTLFNGLAFLFILAGICVLLYQAWGFVTGSGWTSISAADLLDWLGVPPPASSELTAVSFITAILVVAPLGLVCLALGWVCSQISDVIERPG